MEVQSRAALRDHYRDSLTDAVEHRKFQIVGGEEDGVPVVAVANLESAIEEIFDAPIPPIGERNAEVDTPATVLVHTYCPRCQIPTAIVVFLTPLLQVEPGSAELKVKMTGKARSHVCGQQLLPLAPPIADGQMGIDDLIGATTDEIVWTVMEQPDDYLPSGDDGNGNQVPDGETCGAQVALPPHDESQVEILTPAVWEAMNAIDEMELECDRAVDHEDDHYSDGIAWRYETVPVPSGLESPADDVDQEEGTDAASNA